MAGWHDVSRFAQTSTAKERLGTKQSSEDAVARYHGRWENNSKEQKTAEVEIESFRKNLGPFVVGPANAAIAMRTYLFSGRSRRCGVLHPKGPGQAHRRFRAREGSCRCAVGALSGPDEFFGEGCLAGQSRRSMTELPCNGSVQVSGVRLTYHFQRNYDAILSKKSSFPA